MTSHQLRLERDHPLLKEKVRWHLPFSSIVPPNPPNTQTIPRGYTTKELGVGPLPPQSEHLPIGNSPRFVTYTLTPHTPPNTHTIPTVSTTKDWGVVLNTRLSAKDNVVNDANKARRMLFYLNPLLPLPPVFFPLVQNFYPATS